MAISLADRKGRRAMSPMLVLAQVEVWLAGVIGAVALVAGIAIAIVAMKVLAGGTLGRAKVEAARIISDAQAAAKNESQKTQIETERKALERKESLDKELEETRKELREVERRLAKREDLVDRKEEALTLKEQSLAKTSQALQAREGRVGEKEAHVESVLVEQRDKLLQIAGLSAGQARELALQRVEDESRLDVAKMVRKITDDAESQAKERAREITLMAIQRYATEHTSESTVRSVPIPSDDMKGRIIGREGRNIRAIEKATGVDIIVDDTPGVIVVSCFDKVRQAVAVESLERLIADGRMHPSRIEEVVEKVRSEMNEKVIKYGKDSVLEANLRGVHPKVSEAMGKLHFRTSYGQNVLRHSLEVAYLCQLIADQLGLDGTIARRCGFLHDIGKAMDHEMEGGHPKIGMDFAAQHGEKEPILNAIGGHHADMPSTSFYTPIVMAADAISSARPGARRESLDKYIQRLNELQDIALAQKGVVEAYAIQAGREVRVMVDAEKVGDDEAHLIAASIAKRVSEEMTFPGEIRVTVLRETRAIEYAR
jgi:ribonucrease Y